MTNEPLPDWLQAIADQMKTTRVSPVTPDYSQMQPGMTAKEFDNFLRFGSRPPGITLNQSGGGFTYRPSDVPPNAEPWFHEDFGGGPVQPRVPGMSSETPFNWLPGSTPDLSGQTGSGPGPGSRLYRGPPMPAGTPGTEQRMPGFEPGAGYQDTSGPAYAPSWGSWALRSAGNLALRAAPRIAGPLSALAGMVTPTDQLAPRSMDEAPQWSWPQQ